jgi:hypothetical protein
MTGPTPSTARTSRRRRSWNMPAGVLLLVAVAGLGAYLVSGRARLDPSPAALGAARAAREPEPPPTSAASPTLP